MTNPVVIGDATLYLGDAREILPGLAPVDLVCTDAPYRLTTGGKAQGERLPGFGGFMKDYDNRGDIVTCDIEWQEWMPLVFACLKEDRQAYFMSNGRQLFQAHAAATAAGFELHTVLVWDKRSALPNRWYQNVTEFTLFMRKGRAFTIHRPASKNLWSEYQRDESRHPTEKPIALMMDYISNSSRAGDVVLDPFAGSGTTGVAAIRSKRKFIGIELERKWFDVACERVAAAHDDRGFHRPHNRKLVEPGQAVLFDDGGAV